MLNKKETLVLNRKILIVLVSYNTSYFTQECIKSIHETLHKDSYKIIVVDNASIDGIVEWLERQEDILLIKNLENVGFGPACNQAVNATIGTEYETCDIFLLNNDARLAKNSLYYLKEALYISDDIGAVGSISNYAGNQQQVDVVFDRVEDYLEYGRQNNNWLDEPYEERVRLSGFAMLIKREAWNMTGGFDEEFAPGYFEDDALSMELIKNGYRMLLVKNSFIYHAGSQSFIKMDYNKLLTDHRELFIKKYGFDIIDYAYPDYTMVTDTLRLIDQIGRNGCRILQIGSGLGAELKALGSVRSGCEFVGLETNTALYNISCCTERVFKSLSDIKKTYYDGYFDILLITDEIRIVLSSEDKKSISDLCKGNACVVIGKEKYRDFPYDKIKIVVWDLDDTLWKGTLSEGQIVLPDANVSLVRLLTDHGIINSISSKNDSAFVKKKLKEIGIWDDFVFNDINWNEKGLQIAVKLKKMGLRAENTLFIDDNVRNLEEAKVANDGLIIAEPDIIPYLVTYYSKVIPKDITHSRLAQYKLLERKTEVKASVGDTCGEKFLKDSDIRITINRNCLEEINRIYEMVMRTNQLNFTKNRDDKKLLTRQITNDWNDCAYISVRDRFGDYGIVGFYCYNTRENVMEHFLFSCRILGMGIEQYIYGKLGYPSFEIKQPVAIELKGNKEIPWIRETEGKGITEDKIRNNRVRVLLKGPCDMSAIEPYLTGANITTEFNYINDKGFVTTGQNHTEHIVESAELTDVEMEEILDSVPFIIKGDFESKIFLQKYHIICLSLLQDLAAGLYRNRKTGKYISFSSKNYDLTDPGNAARFICKEIQGHNFSFTEKIISDFAKDWEFIGNTPIDMLLNNLDYIYENVQGKPLLILLLGSEIDCKHNKEEFVGMCEIYRKVNPVIKTFAENHERVKIIDPTEFIHSQDDFADCINHYSRNVYYEIAGRICEYINEYI